jgi:hypothetical protein
MKYFQRDSVLWDLLSSTFEGRKIFAKNPALEGRADYQSDWIEQKNQHLKGGKFSPKIQHFLRGGLSDRMSKKIHHLKGGLMIGPDVQIIQHSMGRCVEKNPPHFFAKNPAFICCVHIGPDVQNAKPQPPKY